MMDPYNLIIKEEYQVSGSSPTEDELAAPVPKEGLHETGPPPFLTKTYEMVEDGMTNQIVSWSRGGSSFVVWDPHSFSTDLLPRFFKHNNFSSFVRQLNTYIWDIAESTWKIDAEKWEFANEAFIRGQKHLLKNIKRRKTPSQILPQHQQQPFDACVEVGRFGLDGEIERLKRDKQVLMMELVKLRQQQQNTRAYIQAMEQRLRGTEMKQQQMMQFLARAVRNPGFLHQLSQQKDKQKELEEAMTKKRRRPIDQGPSRITTVKPEPLDYNEHAFEVSELEALALEMQGYGRASRELEEMEPPESGDRELDDRFWEELLNESNGGGEDEEEEDVNTLAERLGYLGSSPK